jgi:hypothetical protein
MDDFIYDDQMLNEIVGILRTQNKPILAEYILYLAETLLTLEDGSSSEEEEHYTDEDVGQTPDGFFYLR